MGRKVLGIDAGTNSVGHALIDTDEKKIIECNVSRIENSSIEPKDRTQIRAARRMNERFKLRRERIIRVLHVLGFLPEHYEKLINFTNHPGQLISGCDDEKFPLISMDGNRLLFKDYYNDMINDIISKNKHFDCSYSKTLYNHTLYYIRKIALSQKISKYALSWILLKANHKRGYNQNIGIHDFSEDEQKKEKENVLSKFPAVVDRIESVSQSDGTANKFIYFFPDSNDGDLQPVRVHKSDLDKLDSVEILYYINKVNEKSGDIENDYKIPSKKELCEISWLKGKKDTESILDGTNKTIGEYIYDSFVNDVNIKIEGNVVSTIDRKYYRNELIAILNEQKKYIPELSDKDLLYKCASELYRNNKAHVDKIMKGDFIDFLVDDVILYQRPLKSQRRYINKCSLEHRNYVDSEGNKKNSMIVTLSKSHPLYEEFRTWNVINNIRIMNDDVDVTEKIMTPETKKYLFDSFMEKPVSGNKFRTLLNKLYNDKEEYKLKYEDMLIQLKNNSFNYNYHAFIKILSKKNKLYPCITFSDEQKYELWNILNSSENICSLHKAMYNFARKLSSGIIKEKQLQKEYCNDFKDIFSKMKISDTEHSRYSYKATKLIVDMMKNKNMNLSDAICDIYGEKQMSEIIDTPEKLKQYISGKIKYDLNSNNVQVNKVIRCIVSIVYDIWKKYGKIDDINIEFAREINGKTAVKNINKKEKENAKNRKRINFLLENIFNKKSDSEIFRLYESDVVNYYSSKKNNSDFSSVKKNLDDLLNKYDVPNKDNDELEETDDDYSEETSKKKAVHVSMEKLIDAGRKYIKFIDGKYLSPYTGLPIYIKDLFDGKKYNIDHIIPQASYVNNTFNNKVICEREVNGKKSSMLGHSFIKKFSGQNFGFGYSSYDILSEEEYVKLVSERFCGEKLSMLLSDEVPSGWKPNQISQTGMITTTLNKILSMIVMEHDEKGNISKHVNIINGTVTTRLKHDWNMYTVWNKLIFPRFKRMNDLTGLYTYKNSEGYERKCNPFFDDIDEKRMDHRNHSLDAIVIACCTKSQCAYIHNDIKNCTVDKKYMLDNNNNLRKPWKNFEYDVEDVLRKVIPVNSNKNKKIFRKNVNRYYHYDKSGKKILYRQTKTGYNVRNRIHDDTKYRRIRVMEKYNIKINGGFEQFNDVFKYKCSIKNEDIKKEFNNELRLNGYDVRALYDKIVKNKNKINGINCSSFIIETDFPDFDNKKLYYYYSTRKSIFDVFKSKKKDDILKKIKSIPEKTPVRNILFNYYNAHINNLDYAFSVEGIENDLNKHISDYNYGKHHFPIKRIRILNKTNKNFSIGENGSKKKTFVSKSKGQNLSVTVYEKDGTREFVMTDLNSLIGKSSINKEIPSGFKMLFTLRHGDLVYVPDKNEDINSIDCSTVKNNVNKIFMFNSYSDSNIFFSPVVLADILKNEYVKQSSKPWDGIPIDYGNNVSEDWFSTLIKNVCIKVDVNSLGEITRIF